MLKSNKIRNKMAKTNTNADMSHQNKLSYKIDQIIKGIKLFGIKKTFLKIIQQINYSLKGIDFSTENLHDLTLKGEHTSHGTALVSTSKDFLKYLFEHLELLTKKRLEKKVFIDFGSGKGAAIIHAKRLGFEKAIGIEFAKELHQKALSNIQKFKLNDVISLHEDAALFIPPSNTTLIFMFNPFDKEVMDKVVKNISKVSYDFDCYLIYVNPSASQSLDKYFELLEKEYLQSGAVIYYYKVA